MGSFLAKQAMFQGYYYDMVPGFLTVAGGRSTVIKYPTNLQKLPEKCHKCNKGSGLDWIAMQDRILGKRREFEVFVNDIITKRKENGHPNPYEGFEICSKATAAALKKTKKREENSTPVASSTGSPSLLRYVKRNEVSPEHGREEPKPEEAVEASGNGDRINFPVNVNDFVVCSCMEEALKKKQKDLMLEMDQRFVEVELNVAKVGDTQNPTPENEDVAKEGKSDGINKGGEGDAGATLAMKAHLE